MVKTTEKAKSFRKSNVGKRIRVCKRDSASMAIGTLEKNTDTFILTYGQFSLIDALMAILLQTGPAHVNISTWTAAHVDLSKSAELMGSADIISLRMIVDRSFQTRQPSYYQHMINLFGAESIRAINTHAKFMTIRNDHWDIVVRTSMNLNGNPRLENMEVSDNKQFADFFQNIVNGVFEEVSVGEMLSEPPKLENIEDSTANLFSLVEGNNIKWSTLNEPGFDFIINELGESSQSSIL